MTDGMSRGPSAPETPSSERLPGPVPHDRADGYVWPTWREALVDACAGVTIAYDRRRRVIQSAYDAGLTFRQIANAVGMSPAAVHKIIGRQRGVPDALLDTPAFQPGEVPTNPASPASGAST